MNKAIYILMLVFGTLSGNTQSGHLINTSYNFSVTIPKGWNLLSKSEIEALRSKENYQDLIMPALAYLGDKKNFDNSPHIYVVFYPQPKIADTGFAKSCKIFLSDKVRGFIVKEMNKRYPKWSFNANRDEYFIDANRRLIMFTSTTKYEDGSEIVVLYCYFLMETGAAEVNFSFNKKFINNYTSLINEVLDSVVIDQDYILKKG